MLDFKPVASDLAGQSCKWTAIRSGSARMDEGPMVEQRVRQNVKSIRSDLAPCFAFYVTSGRGK
jgi:hypothetical protein